MKTIYPIELILWTDSCNTGYGWHEWDQEDMQEYLVISTGFVRYENDEIVALVMSMADHDTESINGQILIIPKCCIKNRRTLKK